MVTSTKKFTRCSQRASWFKEKRGRCVDSSRPCMAWNRKDVMTQTLLHQLQAICGLVTTPKPLANLSTLIYPLLPIHSIYTLHLCFSVLSPNPQSMTPALCSVLFFPSSINPCIMYSSSSVWNQIKLHHIASHLNCVTYTLSDMACSNYDLLLLLSFHMNLCLSICPKYRERTWE